MTTIAVVGGGSRGSTLARHALESGRGRIAAIAEPDEGRRQKLMKVHGVESGLAFETWEQLVSQERLADAAIVATQDSDHTGPAVALAQKGYHVLLEKPMATNESDAERIVKTARDCGVLLSVCLVLRYSPYARRLRRVIDSGVLGDIVSVDHLEPVGWWHQAHSYVRGPWRSESLSSPMLLAKSVHDIDWIIDMIGRRARRVSSFGSLYHFRREQAPDGAADNCLDCPVEPTCPYSAPRLYLSCLGDPATEEWPLSTVTDARTSAGVLEALRTSPYGKCVYSGDNDVVDHQVVALEFDQGVTASFTMAAFTPMWFRHTRVFGTHGYAEGDGHQIRVHDFRTRDRRVIEGFDEQETVGAHGGGDRGLVFAFIDAVARGDDSALVPPEESLESHRVAWAAEDARHRRGVVELSPNSAQTSQQRGKR
ncbi:MAG: gfo/Idh/MocA family oxidoreductase [Acidimicrobiia bacterium]|nr:gfo/Idh/MocA family oxidoreductase [Acidimicrobiia bacterium]